MFFKQAGHLGRSDNLFAKSLSGRPCRLPAPYQVLVYRQGEGREEGRLWGEFGGSGVIFRLLHHAG